MSIESDRWVPGIGDPTVIGWVTVAVYFVVALISLKATFLSQQNNLAKCNSRQDKSIKVFWLFLTFFLIALGINKQLDLQSLLTQIGRDIAKSHGWYKDRRLFQTGFIILIGVIGITSLTLLIRTYRNTCYSIKIALTGCAILFIFILIRASSFHHMDIFINMKLIGIKMNWLLELGSLAIIGLGGYRYTLLNKITSS